jgi:hypothetical protein
MLGGLGRAENANEDGEVPDNAGPLDDDVNVSKKKKVISSIRKELNNLFDVAILTTNFGDGSG